jgi:hypothetical protein
MSLVWIPHRTLSISTLVLAILSYPRQISGTDSQTLIGQNLSQPTLGASATRSKVGPHIIGTRIDATQAKPTQVLAHPVSFSNLRSLEGVALKSPAMTKPAPKRVPLKVPSLLTPEKLSPSDFMKRDSLQQPKRAKNKEKVSR